MRSARSRASPPGNIQGVKSLELLLLAVLVVGVGLVVLASHLRVPYPILLIGGGVGLGFIPGLPDVRIPPDVVLLGLLPPLLYSAAFFLPLGELRANLWPISLLAVVVVLLTTAAVAAVAHAAFGLDWPVAFVLGAIVSPTDPTAVEAIGHRLAVPRRLISVIQGESLVNDGTALAIYAAAVAAVSSASISVPGLVGRFALGLVGGVAIGLALGWLVAHVRLRLDSAPEELALSLLAAYAAYLGAQYVGVSGVLAAVAIGAYHGRHQSQLTSPGTRIQTFAFWELLVFLVNVALFVLVGLQLPSILDGLTGRGAGELIADASLVVVIVVLVRLAWVASSTALLHLVDRHGRRTRALPWRYSVVVGVAGMRGGVSLAAALALPLTVAGSRPFPARDFLVFLAFAVIVGTLVPQGLGLPVLLRRLRLGGDEEVEREEAEARVAVARAAAERLDELRDESWVRDETADRLEGTYRFRERRFAARLGEHEAEDVEARSADYQRLRRELLGAEREALARLRDEGEIDGDVMRRVEHDLDLEDNRLES